MNDLVFVQSKNNIENSRWPIETKINIESLKQST